MLCLHVSSGVFKDSVVRPLIGSQEALLSDTSLLMFQASSSPSGHSYRETGPLLGGD